MPLWIQFTLGVVSAPTGDLTTQQQSAFLDNQFNGPNDQATNFDPDATGQVYRVGHLAGLQRSSRAADGTPLHIRNDGPGLSSQDVPDGTAQPTLEFMAIAPTAKFFRVLRINAASLDFVQAGDQGGTAASVPPGVQPSASGDDGLERFTQATRRQNFLVPPRRRLRDAGLRVTSPRIAMLEALDDADEYFTADEVRQAVLARLGSSIASSSAAVIAL